VIDEHFNKAEHTKLRIEKLYNDTEALRQRKDELEANRNAVEAQLREKERRHRELKERLWELKHTQEGISEKIEKAKEDHGRMKAVLEEKVSETMSVKQEAAKLRPYAQQSPQALENSLRDLNSTLSADRMQIDSLDRRSRALQTSTDTFATVTADVAACTRLLTDLSHDLAGEEEEAAKAARHQQALSERSRNVSDVERQERLLQKQLSNILARTEKLRKSADEKADKAKERMDELKAVHQQLVKERTETGRGVEERRVRIEQVEKKVSRKFPAAQGFPRAACLWLSLLHPNTNYRTDGRHEREYRKRGRASKRGISQNGEPHQVIYQRDGAEHCRQMM